MTVLRDRRDGGDFRIFVSYRRDDAAGHAGRLDDALLEHFQREQIFMDIDAIEPGLDFVESIERALSQCDVLLVLIGPRWLGPQGSAGRRRLDDPADFVRLEVQSALARTDLRVVPVLIQGAEMPTSADLPPELQPLVRRNALEVSDTRWQYDISQLIELLKRIERAKDEIAARGAVVQPTGGGMAAVSATVRFRSRSRIGVIGGLAAIGTVLALLFAVMNVRPSTDGSVGNVGGSPVASSALPSVGRSAPADTAAASAVSSPSAVNSPVASGAPQVAGATIATFQATDDAKTAPFTVDESWFLEWTSEAYFSVFVSVAEDRSVFHLDGLRSDGSAGVTPMYSPGTFYLTVYATGPWTITIKDATEWPRTMLPYSLAGEASMNTPAFEQSGTTRVCWESDGDSTFILDLWSLSRRGAESAQSAVIESGATQGCTDLEARSKDGYLQVFTLGGTWTVSAQVR